VWPYKKVYPMAMMPRADAGTGYRSYWFYFFGFIFLLALGRKIPAQQAADLLVSLSGEVPDAQPGTGKPSQGGHQHRAPLAGSFKEIQAIRSKAPSKGQARLT